MTFKLKLLRKDDFNPLLLNNIDGLFCYNVNNSYEMEYSEKEDMYYFQTIHGERLPVSYKPQKGNRIGRTPYTLSTTISFLSGTNFEFYPTYEDLKDKKNGININIILAILESQSLKSQKSSKSSK